MLLPQGIKSPLLCRLSYRPVVCLANTEGCTCDLSLLSFSAPWYGSAASSNNLASLGPRPASILQESERLVENGVRINIVPPRLQGFQREEGRF